jgi:hypothetical protein
VEPLGAPLENRGGTVCVKTRRLLRLNDTQFSAAAPGLLPSCAAPRRTMLRAIVRELPQGGHAAQRPQNLPIFAAGKKLASKDTEATILFQFRPQGHRR